MKTYEQTGVLTAKDLCMPTEKQLRKGVAVIECVQQIPCNPCVAVCPSHAISMKDINDTPHIDYDTCIGCGKCVAACPGLAIFMIKLLDEKALITIPYEFLPVPSVGDNVHPIDREGKNRGTAKVTKVKQSNNTTVVTIEIPKELAMEIRHLKVRPHD